MHRLNEMKGFLLVTAAAVLLAGCATVGSDYAPPTVHVPSGWREPGNWIVEADSSATEDWWSTLHDPTLDRLIDRVRTNGLDVREAFARLREARALRGIAAADRFPTVEAGASYSRLRESEQVPPGTPADDADLFVAGLDAAWEIDLWGRVRRAVEAASADLAASAEDARDVTRLMVAETAAAYVELRAFQRRVALAQTNVVLQQQTLELVVARFEAGLVSERDVAQAATNVEVTRSRVPALAAGERAAENRLAVLLGQAPGALAGELAALQPIPVPPAQASIRLPADLIRQRPDIRRAERIVAAEHARMGVATAELYPRLTLSGSIGAAAGDASDLFRRGSEFFGFGPSLRWNVFNGGRVRRQIEAQEARAQQALIRWERTVLVALEETENAMTGVVRGQARRDFLLKAAAQARRAVELAQFEYREGASDFQIVLDSERALAQLEDELAQADAGIATQFIALQKAIGG